MRERVVVPIKFPIYLGDKRPRNYKGDIILTEPFVESWHLFNILTQQFTTIRSQVHLGLRIPSIDEDYIGGGGNANEPDPIRLYRALKILDRIDIINNPHEALDLAYSTASPTLSLNYYRNARSKVKSLIGKDTFGEILQMIPLNLMSVVENLRKHRVAINCWTLQREIRAGKVESTPLYEGLIHRYEIKRERSKEVFSRMYEILNT